MGTLREWRYPSSDGIHSVYVREWIPEGKVRCILQITHGVADHIRRYDHVAQFLSDQGVWVCGEDHLGHGHTASDGKYGYFASEQGWELVIQDIHQLRQQMEARCPGVPYVMLGHSMGSFLIRTYLLRGYAPLDGVVLSGTGQEFSGVVWCGKTLSALLAKLRGGEYVSKLVYDLSMGAYNNQFKPVRTSADWVSRDEEQVDIRVADPWCSFMPTVQLYVDMLGALQHLAKQSNLVGMDPNIPVYFFSGDQDPVGGQGKGVNHVADMFRTAGCKDVEVKLYPGGRHEMFNEINRQEVMDDLLCWLENRVIQ